MGGRQILPSGVSLPPTRFNVLMIPSVAILNANKKIVLPATIAISRGFPAAVDSTVERLLKQMLDDIRHSEETECYPHKFNEAKAFTETEIHYVYVCV